MTPPQIQTGQTQRSVPSARTAAGLRTKLVDCGLVFVICTRLWHVQSADVNTCSGLLQANLCRHLGRLVCKSCSSTGEHGAALQLIPQLRKHKEGVAIHGFCIATQQRLASLVVQACCFGFGFTTALGLVDCSTDIQWLHCPRCYCCCTLLQEEASEEEAELDDETWAKNVTAGKLSKGEKLAAVDHNTMDYPQFRRRFYIEVPEIQRLTEEEVALLRETEGVKVRGPD